jgi:hypothetical protein
MKLEFFRNPGTARAQPGMGLHTATGIFGLAGNHVDLGTDTPAIVPKRLYCGDSGFTTRRYIGHEHGRGGGGMSGGILSVDGGNFRLREETFGSTAAGKALEARSGRTQVR